MNRCNWCNLKNQKYIEYHDKEWGVPNFDDKHLLEMLILLIFFMLLIQRYYNKNYN